MNDPVTMEVTAEVALLQALVRPLARCELQATLRLKNSEHGHKRRPDLVVFINGISVDMANGIRQLITNQEAIFNQGLFSTVQWVLVQAKFCRITLSTARRFGHGCNHGCNARKKSGGVQGDDFFDGQRSIVTVHMATYGQVGNGAVQDPAQLTTNLGFIWRSDPGIECGFRDDDVQQVADDVRDVGGRHLCFCQRCIEK